MRYSMVEGTITSTSVNKGRFSDLKHIKTSVSYGGYIQSIAVDAHIYLYVGRHNKQLRKYLKWSYIGWNTDYGGTIQVNSNRWHIYLYGNETTKQN